MTENKQVKAALEALADGDGDTTRHTTDDDCRGELSSSQTAARRLDSTDYRAVIERASRATDDIGAAAAFVETVGVGTLERAVGQAEREVSGVAEDGRNALAAFEQFRAVVDDGHDGP